MVCESLYAANYTPMHDYNYVIMIPTVFSPHFQYKTFFYSF